MKGMIRTMVGLILVMGGVGGMENSGDLMPSLLYAVIGLGLMAWGVSAMKIKDIKY